MRINSSTELYGIYGHPVKHSFSPSMHNAAFNALGINSVYLAFDILPDDLQHAVESIRYLGIKGINVTIPHKQEIIIYLDHISTEATHTGAVNTVKNVDGKLYGHNTDVGGFLKALEVDLNLQVLSGKKVLILGAGGAARAVLSGLCMRGVKSINIFNRSVERAAVLSDYFGKQFKNISVKSYDLTDDKTMNECLAVSDLVVNSTSAGMVGHESIELPLQNLREKSYVYDLVYNPRETQLVKHARSYGHNAASGLSMLLYQGVESFEQWTGRKAPVDLMRESLIKN